jgi:hypothetical protein
MRAGARSQSVRRAEDLRRTFRRPNNAHEKISVPQIRKGPVATLKWLSPWTTPRQKWGRQRWPPWCSIFRSRLGKPCPGAIQLAQLLYFQRKPGPCPCDVNKNVLDAGIRCTLRHPLTFGARSLHFSAVSMATCEGASRHTPKRKPRREPGSPSGVYCLAGLGVGGSAKLAYQSKTDLTVPEIFTSRPNLYGNFYSSSC